MDQYSGSKSKMTPRDECQGRDYRPGPSPSLAGGGTNPSIARQQDTMWSKPVSKKVASQFSGK
jgi:hypothetical protein